MSEPTPAPDLAPDLAPVPAAGPAARPWYVSALLALAAVALLLLLAWGTARLRSPYPFFGTTYGTDVEAAGFQGVDMNGRPYAFTPGQGEAGQGVTALFFGFTHCPNICPLTLSYLAKVRAALPGAERERFEVLFVSVDPDRDTPALLREYVSYFGQGTGVRVPEPALSALAKRYGVGYQKVDVKSAQTYQINHTTATYLIDAAGKLRVLWDYSQLPQVERIRADVQYVLENPAP